MARSKKRVLELGLTSSTSDQTPKKPPTSKPEEPEETSSGPLSVVAQRIKQALLDDPNLRPSSWIEVIRGLELLLRYHMKDELTDADINETMDVLEEKLQSLEKLEIPFKDSEK